MLKKFLVFATVVAVAFGLTQVPLSGTYNGQLTISDYETYYIEYPENTSYVGISLAATELTGGDCDYLYFYGPNTFGIPCGSYPDNDIPNVNNDPCDPTDYTSVSTGSSTSTRYYAVGRYVNTVLGYTVYPAGGKLFFTVNKYDEDDTGCGFTITTTTSACPNADRANNGIAIGTGGSTYTSSVPELDCAVYTNISLTSSDVADQQKINNATGYVVYKAIIAKNTAYVNVTLTGTSDVSSSFVVTGAYYAATTSTDSDLSCSKTIYFDSTSLNGTTTFTCFNVPQGPFYITLDIGSDQYFNGTLTTTAHICADGTATFGFDSDDNNLNCSAAYYFNATSLVSGTPINFTNVATGFYQQGYFDFPAQLVGGSITLNYTGCASATSCTAYFGVSLTMNPGINDNYFYTSSSFNGFSLNSFDTNANGTFNTISGGQRFYVSYYCSTGPCSSSIFLSGFVPPPPAVTTTSGTTGNSTTTARATSTAGVTGTTSNSTSTTTATSTARLTSTGNSTTSSNTTTTARATSTGGNASSSAVVIPSLAIAFVALVAALF